MRSKVACLYLSLIILFFYSCSSEEKKDKVESKSSKAAGKKKITPPDFNEDSAYAFVAHQVAFGPRVPGTEAHEKCKNWLVNKFGSYGLKVTQQDFSAVAYNGKTLNGTNIIASLEFEKATKRILLAAHWDTRPFADQDETNQEKAIDGASDGASGVAVLLELARYFKNKEIPFNVDFILFDLEDYGAPENERDNLKGESWCLGSQHWGRTPHVDGYGAYFGILLDMVGAKDAKFALEGTSMKFAPNLMNKVWSNAHDLGYQEYFIFKNVPGITDDHLYINTLRSIPTIDIVQYSGDGYSFFAHYWHTHEDNMSIISKSTLDAVGSTVAYTLKNY